MPNSGQEESDMYRAGYRWKEYMQGSEVATDTLQEEIVPFMEAVFRTLPEWFPFRPVIVPLNDTYVTTVSPAQIDMLLTYIVNCKSTEAVELMTFALIMNNYEEVRLDFNAALPATPEEVKEWQRGFSQE